MIPIRRLAKLHGIARTRKCALLLQRLQLELAENQSLRPAAFSLADSFASERLAYVRELARFLAEGAESPGELSSAAAAAASAYLAAQTSASDFAAVFRAIDDFRHALMRLSGQAPADWDLMDFRSTSVFPSGAAGREPLFSRQASGRKAYLEDIRSPFNVGSIFRVAEAFGFDELILSPACADPAHPRALRSSMGTTDLVPWRRADLSALSAGGPLFALELGGRPLEEFAFPESGIVVLGSEELGVSAPALERCALGKVSIPMSGAKASLNVAVAFGICAQRWASRPALRPGRG